MSGGLGGGAGVVVVGVGTGGVGTRGEVQWVDAGFRSVAGEHEGVVGVLSFEELPFRFVAGVFVVEFGELRVLGDGGQFGNVA